MNTGTIVQVNGPLVDVEFSGALPGIYSALSVDCRVNGEPGRLTLEVQQHLDDHRVRAISMSATNGLKRGFDAVDTGGLDDSWRQQPGTPVYAADLPADAARRALSDARRPAARA